MATTEETSLPLEPLALMVFDDGSSRVGTIEEAVREMELADAEGTYSLHAYAFMGALFVLEGGEDDEPVDTEE